jgi:hypothetical protein
MKRSKSLRPRNSPNYVPHIIRPIYGIPPDRQLPRVISVDFSDFDHLTLLIPHLICRLQWIHGSCGLKEVPGHVLIVKRIELRASPCIWPLRPRPVNVTHRQHVPRLVVLLHSRLRSIDILIRDLVSDEFRWRGGPVLYLGELVLGVQGVRGLAAGEKALTLRF